MAKKYKAILYDMDGTLVPMDMKEFTDGYFRLLAKRLAPYNIPTDTLIDSIWKGTAAMVRNDGSRKNIEAFWETFYKLTGVTDESIEAECDSFYGEEFKGAKAFTQDNPLATKAVNISRDKADIVALATNPLFPLPGQITRMEWVGLKPDDFDLVTSYESDVYCKPNPKYFESVCERLGVKPSECLMIGNDEEEDMFAACTVCGMDGFLVTDTMIESKEHHWDGPRGTFAEMVEMLNSL
ncbi:MAG: HAD family hydrolase [Lachnospiraceae bacterium]|nr:HAD family hydrolase [Lachnospiraceae bacterium]